VCFFFARVLIKTQEYLEIFARFKQKESIEAVEHILMAQTDLDPFERAQLGKGIS
jgi:DNA-directed RNA polymerase II subunit RPB4